MPSKRLTSRDLNRADLLAPERIPCQSDDPLPVLQAMTEPSGSAEISYHEPKAERSRLSVHTSQSKDGRDQQTPEGCWLCRPSSA
jgi:hypothetical protein